MHYVFHPHREAIVVPTSEYQKYLDSGWYDSPLKFPTSPQVISDVDVTQIKKKGRPPNKKPEEIISQERRPPLDVA